MATELQIDTGSGGMGRIVLTALSCLNDWENVMLKKPAQWLSHVVVVVSTVVVDVASGFAVYMDM